MFVVELKFLFYKGLVFYLSPSVRPSYRDLTDMITAAGGTVTNDIPTLSMIYEPFKDEFKTVHILENLIFFNFEKILEFEKQICNYWISSRFMYT